MDFVAVLDQVIALLRQRGRVTYSTLKRQFQLDDAALEDVKNELIAGQGLAVDERGNVLVWGDTANPAVPAPSPTAPMQTPLTYTPSYLAEKILTSRSALEGERKQVTVLFADLKGSMELLADRDPEEARQLLDPVLEHMMVAVHRYEGTVNQVMGDGIMALFGAPVAHEDHAVRACYAALHMQEAIRRYSTEVRRTHGVEVQIRVGLNSGEVVVRAIGNDLHMDYSAIGQTTHLAARLEQLATPGSIRLSTETLRLAEGLVQVSTLGPVPVKGLVEPVEVFELVGTSSLRRRLQVAATRGLTHFVGRHVELAALHQALEWAGAGHGQVVAAVGEAGVGKSRLVYEVVHSHRTQGWLVLESASVSYGKATPYFPVLDLLKRYMRVEDRDETRTIRAKVTGHILTLDEALQETIPALLWLLDALSEAHPFLSLDPPLRRRRTLDALKRVLVRESQVQPLLLVFEDLHWIDAETQALLDSLVDSLPTVRLLLLVNYRPEYQHGWGSKTYYTQLRLDPLPPANAEEFLQALLGDDVGATGRSPLQALKQLLIERTQGNPFFLEESVRALVEAGVLVGERGAYHLATPPDNLQVPVTVQAVLAARIDRLPPEEKHVLQTAAVIGTEVPLPLVQAIAELPEVDLYRDLIHLQATEFLYETRLFPERAFTFKHALTHEVAYNGLLQERRRMLHGRIVEHLTALSAERQAEQVERLAHHAMRGEVWDKAVTYCQQAAARAMAGSAYRAAVGYFEQALAALAQLPERRATLEQSIDVRCDLRNALLPLDEHARILDSLRTAEILAEQLGDDQRRGRIAGQLCLSLLAMGENELAIAAGQRTLALALSSGARDLLASAQTVLAMVYLHGGDFREALDVAQRAVAALTGPLRYAHFGRLILPGVSSRYYLAVCLAELGEITTGRDVGEEAVRLAEEVEHSYSMALALWYVGMFRLRQRDIQAAISMLERGLALCQSTDILLLVPLLTASLGAAYALAGRGVEARPFLDQTLEHVASGSRVFHLAHVLIELCEGLLLVSRVEDAGVLASHLLDLSRTHPGRGYQAHAYRLLGEVARHRAPLDVDQVAAHYQQALGLAETLGMRPLVAHCNLGLGRLYGQTGRGAQAYAALTTAIDLYRAMVMTFWLPQAEAALAQVETE